MNGTNKLKILSLLLGLSVLAICILSFQVIDLKCEIKSTQEATLFPSTKTFPESWSKNWDPWNEPWYDIARFSELQKQMDEMMNLMKPGGATFSQQGFGLSLSSPKVTMKENAKEYEVLISVPESENIQLDTKIDEGVLIISGKVTNNNEEKSQHSLSHSYSTSQFSQSIVLPQPIDEAAMSVQNTPREMIIRIPKM